MPVCRGMFEICPMKVHVCVAWELVVLDLTDLKAHLSPQGHLFGVWGRVLGKDKTCTCCFPFLPGFQFPLNTNLWDRCTWELPSFCTS